VRGDNTSQSLILWDSYKKKPVEVFDRSRRFSPTADAVSLLCIT